MIKKLFSVLVSLAFLLMFIPAPVSAALKLPDYRPVDAGPHLRAVNPTREILADKPAFLVPNAPVSMAAPDCVTATKTFLILDDDYGVYRFRAFDLYAEGPAAQIWVQADLSWPSGDPRATPSITCDQATYMLGQFENKIQPKETTFFGPPDFLDGSTSLLEAWGYVPPDYYDDAAGRQIVLVSNVRDANYYDYNYPIYIAGFYSGTLEAYFGRNTMSIDAYDWANRTGPVSARPYLYEGIFAHEYQHLLHDDYDPLEENWINEGLADWAMWLTGYGAAVGHLEDLIDMPENSLVAWGDQGDLEILADYGIAYLYQEFMYEKYGQAFIQNEFHSTLQGIESVNAVLAGLGASETFADTYHKFAAAMYTKGAFTLKDLRTFQVDVGHPGKPNPEAFATPGAPPWGADYLLVWGYESIANLKFNGYQFNPINWRSDGNALWSNTGDLIDNWAIFETTGGGTLTFDTSYNIEEAWDFGFVQVSTDGGYTWASLSNAYSTAVHDPDAHPNIIMNLPGLTGNSGGWVTMSYDLSAYAGQPIMIGFRYMTDWATTFDGWYIDNVYVDGTLISDGSSTDGFKSLNEVLGISNDYTVLLIGEQIRAGRPRYEVQTLISGGYAADWYSVRKMFNKYRWLVVVVIYDAPQGVTSYADYTFQVDHRGGVHIK